jgi:crotonobetainyl-CoA:carnitine CoA-transferase CaiB-like acyl-CoA transferase
MGPLAGVRILDLTSVILGPFATHILATMGAEVIKVETPEGDNMRDVGPMKHQKMGHIFLHLNRGKKSIVLDLKSAEGKKAILALVKTADVFISNIRLQALERLGLGYEDLRQIHPQLIYVSCSGFGQDGIYAQKPAYDDLIQAAVGLPWLMQEYGIEEPRYVPTTIGDRVTGLYSVNAVTAALYAREKTGQGQRVIVPMFEALTQFVLGDHMAGETYVPAIGKAGYQRLISPHRKPYATKDGYISTLIYNDKHWKSFFEAIEQPHRYQETIFCSHANRATNIDQVYAELATLMKAKTTQEWRTLFDQFDIPNQTVNSIHDLIHDEHLKSKDFIVQEQHPTEGMIRVMRDPVDWSATPTSHQLSPTPTLGQHTTEVLRSLGYLDDEIQAVLKTGKPS